ncbi:MAG: 4-alpha-glucanotransferase [Gemmatimonadaceae bacterium]
MALEVATHRPLLRALSEEVGIIPGYRDQTGAEWRETSDETRVLLLAAMGIDASTEAAAEAALDRLRRERTERLVEVARVVEAGAADADHVVVQLAEPQAGRVRWELELVEESGRVHEASGEEPHGAGYTLTLRLPATPPLGYHQLRVAVWTERASAAAEQSLIVVPRSCVRAGELLRGGKGWGLIANLYTLRSDRNWGVGDLTDLAEVLEWAGELGAQFVGVNPLHVLHNRGTEVSPYSPASRLFRNPLYIDVEQVPELSYAARIRARLDAPELLHELEELRTADRVDYERVMDLKLSVLESLHRVFLERTDLERQHAYEAWCAEREPELTDYATYMALARGGRREEGGESPQHSPLFPPPSLLPPLGPDWRSWPHEFRTPRTPAVREFRRSNAALIDFHRWLQFETDRQLGEAAERARASGLAIGLYQDLAIGTSPAGSDTWSLPDLFVRGVCIGAPPDPYSATGQNWGLPPIDPRQLAQDGYRYFIRLVRAAFRHAGALRIDHVMGLFRAFWIPEGHTGADGAYVRYPSDDLLGILALESVRNNALVVGEDLGTVPPDVPPALEKWGILSSKVLYFERGDGGSFRPADRYATEALATANTHDMATLAGFWEGRDVELRAEVGLIEKDAVDAAWEERARDKHQLVRALKKARVLDERVDADVDDPPISDAELRGAVHDFLALTPSVLVGVALDDVAGETDPVNVPGVGPDKHPSWTRRMSKSLTELREDPETSVALGTLLRTERGGRESSQFRVPSSE